MRLPIDYRHRRRVVYICALLALFAVPTASRSKECASDANCEERWPGSVCRKGRCACRPDSIRRATGEFGEWACVSLFDVVTGQLGPPLSCPLPDGAGFRMILKRDDERLAFCNFHEYQSDGCPPTHDCIKAIGTFSDQWNGVCCPKRTYACDSLPDTEAGGHLERWYFNGTTCRQFFWNPEATVSANTFLTQHHCEMYCGAAASTAAPTGPDGGAEAAVVLRIES